MHDDERTSPFPLLDELKTRGDNAMAETRQIIRDLKLHAHDVHRDVVTTVRGRRAKR